MKTIYMDNNATTKVAEEVFEEMKPYFTDFYGNPSSMHTFGGQIAHRISRAREQVAGLLSCEPSEIIFTSCGTESDNAAIKGTLAAVPNKRKIITTRVEHPAVLTVCRELGNYGYTVVELGVDKQGQLDLAELEEAIDDNTALVTIMYANNETGVVFPIDKIAELVTSRGIVFHTDAVQAIGKIPLNLSKSNIDLLSLSGHKLHAPKGVGILYVRKGTRISPFMLGGHQEAGRRAGTENVPAIVGMGKAAELAKKELQKRINHVKTLRDKLINNSLKIDKVYLTGHPEKRLPGHASFVVEYIEGEAMLLLLANNGICTASGSACSSKALKASPVLISIGIPAHLAQGSVVFTLGEGTTDEDIDYFNETFPQIITRLREISPYAKGWEGTEDPTCTAKK